MSIKRLLVFVLFFASTATIARPAPWYWWISKVDSTRVCAQTPQGSGWIRESIAFKDSNCTTRLYPR